MTKILKTELPRIQTNKFFVTEKLRGNFFSKMFAHLKTYINFAAVFAKHSFFGLIVCGIFISTNIAVYAVNTGYHSDGYYTERSVIVFGDTERVASSFLNFINFSFSFMPNTMKDASRFKSTTPQSTSNSTKTVSRAAFNIEMKAKNTAFFFILSHGLFSQFADFCKHYNSNDPHSDCINYLLSHI